MLTYSDILAPNASSVIKACAGSGKTYLLTRRIISLLLNHTDPRSILAITFTNKAAYEIQSRVNQEVRHLSALARKDHQQLLSYLDANNLSFKPSAENFIYCENLERTLLLTDNSFRISTFHAWFNELIDSLVGDHQLALPRKLNSLGVDLQEQICMHIYRQIRQGKISDNLFTRGVKELGQAELFELVKEILNNESYIKMMPKPTSSKFNFDDYALTSKKMMQLLADILPKLPELKNNQSLRAAINNQDPASMVLSLRKERPKKTINIIIQFFEQLTDNAKSEAQAAKIAILCDCWQNIENEYVIVLEQYLGEYLHLLSHAVIELSEEFKQDRQTMNFNDLEYFAWHLLCQQHSVDNIQRKLNRRYEHILIDEMQDINIIQYKIVEAWLNNNLGNDYHCSLFAVGDEKQSLYRFRGADAALLDQCHEFASAKLGGKLYQTNFSRRCPRILIELCNELFTHYSDLGLNYLPHELPEQDGGYLCLHHPLGEDDNTKSTDIYMRNPLEEERKQTTNLQPQMAKQVANLINDYVHNRLIKDTLGNLRPCTFADIMIIAPKLTDCQAAISTELSAAHIPFNCVANAPNKLNQPEWLLIADLLETVYCYPTNKALLAVLKSPICNLSDAQIYDLLNQAADLKHKDLFASLCKVANKPDHFAHAAVSQILRYRQQASSHSLPVHDILSMIYDDSELITNYLRTTSELQHARILNNLQDILDLSLELEYATTISASSLMRKLRKIAITGNSTEQSGSTNNSVLFTTIHRAKGLEAPVVILLNAQYSKTTRDAASNRSYKIKVDWPFTTEIPTAINLVARNDEQERLLQMQLPEKLYVACTRSCYSLHVFSIADKKENVNSWYQQIKTAISALATSHNVNVNSNNDMEIGKQLSKHEAITEATATLPVPKQPNEPSKSNTPAPSLPCIKEVGEIRSLVPPKDAIIIGEAVHRRIQCILAGWDETTLAAQTDYLLFGKERTHLQTIENHAQKILSCAQLQKFLHLAKHKWLEQPITNNAESMRIDLLLQMADNQYVVVDFKTGELQLAKWKQQLTKYQLALADNLNLPAENISIAVVDTNGTWHDF